MVLMMIVPGSPILCLDANTMHTIHSNTMSRIMISIIKQTNHIYDIK